MANRCGPKHGSRRARVKPTQRPNHGDERVCGITLTSTDDVEDKVVAKVRVR